MKSEKPQTVGRLVAIVVTRNRLSHLKTCVRALLQSPRNQLEAVVVVDNASLDGSSQWLKTQEDPRLFVVSLTTNLGGAGGFAEGMRTAQEHFAPDWIVLLDDDACPELDAIDFFHAKTRDRNVAYAASVFDAQGDPSELNRPFMSPFQSYLRFMATLVAGKSAYYVSDKELRDDKVIAVDFATFVGFFVSQKALQEIGVPDRRFFVYCDDLDFCHRLARAGYRIEVDPSIRFRHDCATFENGSRIYTPLWKSYYAHRNGLYFARRAPGRLAPFVVFGLTFLWAFRWIYYANPLLYLALLSVALKDGLRPNFSRDHSEILRRAALGTGWNTTVIPKPSAEKISPANITKPS